MGKSLDYVVTETTVAAGTSPAALVEFLQSRKTTGQLTIHLSQGAVQKMGVTEKTKIVLDD